MNFFNRILSPFNIQLTRITYLNKGKNYNENTIRRLSEFYIGFKSNNRFDLNEEISGIVFSKDRAMQLHALLSSYFYYTKNYAPLQIIFTFSCKQHKEAYEILQEEFQTFPIEFISETDFAIQLREIVTKLDADRLFFMTDDGVFLDYYDLADCLSFDPFDNIFSLRLGADFEFCYSYNKKQIVPNFSVKDARGHKFNSWKWADMKDSPDWIYPLSVDATIFLKKEIETILNHISFKSPNSLESEMQLYKDLFIYRNGICYEKTKYVNIPCNIVQNEFKNNCTGAFSVDELLTRYLGGERIDWKSLQNLHPREAQTVKFIFINN